MGDVVFNRDFEIEIMIKNEIEIRTLKGFNLNNPGFQPGEKNEKGKKEKRRIHNKSLKNKSNHASQGKQKI
jgi:hypothetical protein